MIRFIAKLFTFFSATLVLFSIAATIVVSMFFYHRLTRDLPRIDRISDYVPRAVTSILDRDGNVVGEVYDQRRYPIDFSDIPTRVKQAFLAAEDADFYNHPGFDLRSILRAVIANLRAGGTVQGASTITQQVVKSLLLSSEKTYERKLKEAILAFKLEKSLSKDDIFSIYLNQIFFGQTAYGIKAAARVHFNKEIEELTLAETSYLAGLPQKPTYYTRPANRKIAIDRQLYVLDQMVRRGFASQEEADAAKNEVLLIHQPDRRQIHSAPYFVSHVLKMVQDNLGLKITHPGGYIVETTLDSAANLVAEKAVRRGLREVDKRRGWRGPLAKFSAVEATEWIALQNQYEQFAEETLYQGLVTKRVGKLFEIQVGATSARLDLSKSDWAKKYISQTDTVRWIDPSSTIAVGDLLEVSLLPQQEQTDAPIFQLDQTPLVQGAFVLANALTGEVISIVGGYDFEVAEFNRATQGMRQPGSAFKPFIYLAAIDELNYTPSTIVPDSPISLLAGDGSIWSPSNYDRKFMGPITFRVALQLSRNVVSVYLLEKIGVEKVIRVARDFGLTTPLEPNLSLSLGTSEVKLIELVRAYGAFAAGGWLADELLVTRILDREGKVVYEQRPAQRKVLDEDTAFIMAHVMKGVVERGTAQLLRRLERPLAGKTGTTNEQMDAWFIGYTPEWTAGAWVGFDVKKNIGKFETGGKAAAPIFLYAMQEFLADKPALDFEIPDGVIPVAVNVTSGRPVGADTQGAFIEYFKIGTEPTLREADANLPQSYLASDQF